uniref:Uncharacterized protein n=1 Tax=Lepeophtheirus salmonis TaxID=72036 RepID=A0A0K2T5X2_LEPSM
MVHTIQLPGFLIIGHAIIGWIKQNNYYIF